MRILIVDDERPARDKLRRLLEQEADCEHIDEARDGVEALEQVAQSRPDVLFLDIQMPEVSGIEVAASLPAPAPLIVFVTAFDQYAISAFDANAIDYLLKPYDQARLQRALARARQRLRSAAASGTATSVPEPGLPVRQLLIRDRQLRGAAHGQRRTVDAADISGFAGQAGRRFCAQPPARRRAAFVDRTGRR